MVDTSSLFCGLLGFVVFLGQSGFAQQLTSDNCFSRFDNTRVQCARPSASRSGISEQQCRDLCYQLSQICQTAQYFPMSLQCDLYSASLSARKKRGSIMRIAVPDSGVPSAIDENPQIVTVQPIYNKNSIGQQQTYNNQQSSIDCNGSYGPSLSNVNGYVLLKPTGQQQGCCSSCGLNGGVTEQTTKAVVTTTPTTTTSSTTTTVATTTASLPAEATCSPKQVVRYIRMSSYQMNGKPDSQFSVANEQECLQSCTDNKQPSGVISPCQSADFDSLSKKCTISLNALPPSGDATKTKNENGVHYEKVCLDASTGQVCLGPIIKAPQKLLVGYAESILTVDSFGECLQNCVNSRTRFAFNCVSGEYYSADTTKNCVLNSESAKSKPDLYIDESRDQVDYFEPGCVTTGRLRRAAQTLSLDRHRRIVWPNIEEWGSWTRCDSLLRNHLRFRKCSSFNPNSCQEDLSKCDPFKRAAELQALRDEEVASPTTVASVLLTTRAQTVASTVSSTTVPNPKTRTNFHPVATASTPFATVEPTSASHTMLANITSIIFVPTASEEKISTPRMTSEFSPTKFASTMITTSISKNKPALIKSVSTSNGTGVPRKPQNLLQISADKATSNNKDVADEGVCEPIVKLDGSFNCKRGFRTLPNGRKQPCKPTVVDNDCAVS